MIKALADWLDSNSARLDDLGLTYAYAERPKRSAWIDLDGPELMCRVIMWETGECDIDCVVIKSGEPTTEHRYLQSEADLIETLAKMLSRLA